jgi:LamB porin
MCFTADSYRQRNLRGLLVAGLALLVAATVYAQDSDSSDVAALKAQMGKVQKQFDDRISTIEAEMQSFESKTDTRSILNTRILADNTRVSADADAKQYEGGGPALDLKGLTRNFSFLAYIRAGVQFNGSGGGGNFNFEPPDNAAAERPRLGNENDVYMELTWMQAHMLGDNPDVMMSLCGSPLRSVTFRIAARLLPVSPAAAKMETISIL